MSKSISIVAVLMVASLLVLSSGVQAQTVGSYSGTLYNMNGQVVTGTPSNGTYFSPNGDIVYYNNGTYYSRLSNQNVSLMSSTPNQTNGSYTTTSGLQVYYFNGWYYAPFGTPGTMSYGTPGAPNTGGNLTQSPIYIGTLYATPSGTSGGAVSSPTSGAIYYTASGQPVYYINGWAYYPVSTQSNTLQIQGINGVPSSNGWYCTSGGQVVYFFNGWFYYPLTGMNCTPNGTVGGTVGTGTTGGTTVTPGVPNTGAGGLSGVAWLMLIISGLVAITGSAYTLRRQV